MKFIATLLLTILICWSCNEKKDASEQSQSKTETTAVSENKEKKTETEKISIADQLKSLEPITEAEMDAWMPEKIGTMNRTYYQPNMTPQMEIFMTKATFKDPTSQKSLDISIMDGAGERGSRAMSPFLNLKNLYQDKSDELGYQKVITKNDMTIVQKYRNTGDKFNLEFAPKQRYAIKIETRALSETELWEAINQFKFDNFKGI